MGKLIGLGLLLAHAAAIDNGLGHTPPMGWRSWNLFGNNVRQSLMESIMDGMVSRKRKVDGQPTSLCDLGYCDVGLDDNWQACGSGSDGFEYHKVDADGSAHPVVNLGRFPSLRRMTDYAHSLGLSAGWYGNNCDCMEKKNATAVEYMGDVMAATGFGFDGIKLDGCGTQMDLDLWSKLFNQTGRPVMIENCHWGRTVPKGDWCPWNFFRTSGDVRASYGSVVGNLQTTVQWAQKNLSRPGCWAYPDMLEVGCAHGPGGSEDHGLSPAETRSHFGSWCIVSSPLTLSHDVRNDTMMDALWPIIANREAIAVNQAWAGHSGSPFKEAEAEVVLEDYNHVVHGQVTPHVAKVPSWQYFYKPLGEERVAVLLMNHGDHTQTLTLELGDVPGLACSQCEVRDVWAHEDLGVFRKTFSVSLGSHDSGFFIIRPDVPETIIYAA